MSRRLTRRSFFRRSAATTVTAAGFARGSCTASRAAARETTHPTARDTFGLRQQGGKIPVILDTDIGGDIDDTWALVMLLKSPELDVKLVTSDSGNDTYRARIIAKILQIAARTDVPVGVGRLAGDKPGPQTAWVGDYDLSQYPGTIHEDGVGAIINVIRASQVPVTLVAIGPVPNIPEALRRGPDIAEKARFVGMHGSVRRGSGGSQEVAAEYNVQQNPKA